MGEQLPDVDGKYGAPMGRPDMIEDASGEAHLFRVIIDEGGYDDGGAYWGVGQPLYCLKGDNFQGFTRQKDRISAESFFATAWPEIKILPLEVETDVLPEFIDGFIKAALFTSSDDDDTPLDREYDETDLADDAIVEIHSECHEFVIKAFDLITQCVEDGWAPPTKDCTAWEYAGHDFWMTRNGHGCGFWDGDWPDEVGEALSKIASSFGEAYLYVGDDGKIYQG